MERGNVASVERAPSSAAFDFEAGRRKPLRSVFQLLVHVGNHG
jgi:hypothetical protein